MFGGFKARLNMLGGKRKKKNDQSELTLDMFVTGAYRVNRENMYGYNTQEPENPRPVRQLTPPLRPVKSTTNLVLPTTANPNLRHSTPTISHNPHGAEQSDRNSVPSPKELKTQQKEQKKLEKRRLNEQKKQAQEQANQEKLMKERARNKTQKVKPTKKQAPTPQPQTSNPVLLQPAYSTNTLDSSISRSSGPPPYSQVPSPEQAGYSDKTGNVVYSKPVDAGSWDIISKHREQINRPATTADSAKGKRKQMVMDLNYNFGTTNNATENSDA